MARYLLPLWCLCCLGLFGRAHGQDKGRAYHGAPPIIPHETTAIGRKNCLSCHSKGRARKNDVAAKVTPHPERTHCIQCHVPLKSTNLFKNNLFDGYHVLRLDPPSNPFGPPYIPHRLQDRENCLVCHSQALPASHAHRQNCLQCHVVRQMGAKSFPGMGR